MELPLGLSSRLHTATRKGRGTNNARSVLLATSLWRPVQHEKKRLQYTPFGKCVHRDLRVPFLRRTFCKPAKAGITVSFLQIRQRTLLGFVCSSSEPPEPSRLCLPDLGPPHGAVF